MAGLADGSVGDVYGAGLAVRHGGSLQGRLLVQRGGTNLLAALLYFGIMCLLQVAILYMAGPSAIQYLMTMAGA